MKGEDEKMRQYELFELEFSGEAPQGSEVNVDISGTFIFNGKEMHIKGFYAGNNIYKVRFLPQETGEYSWKIHSGINLQGKLEGSEISEPADEKRHGLVRTEGLHFRYEDGKRYQPFGTTIYALVHQDRDLITQTMQTLGEAPFNKVRFCVFPKHYDFNHNEP